MHRALLISFLLGLFLTEASLLGPASLAGASDVGVSYVSPNWGVGVRWDSAEWSEIAETSEDGFDILSLGNASGHRLDFLAGTGYGGDAAACLDDQLRDTADIPGTEEIAVVRDDQDVPQVARDPRRSWVLLLVAHSDGSTVSEYVVYLECQMLVPGEAVLSRRGVGAVDTLPPDFAGFDGLAAVLPRAAWQVRDDGQPTMPYSPLVPSPTATLLYQNDGAEWGLLTETAGDRDTRYVVIENSGQTPLIAEPVRFALELRGLLMPGAPEDLEPIWPVAATWDDVGGGAARTLSPGERATLTIEFPAELDAYLNEEWFDAAVIYQDPALMSSLPHPWELIGRDGATRATMTVVRDAASNEEILTVRVENIGWQPFTVDPSHFIISGGSVAFSGGTMELPSGWIVSATWGDDGDTAPRTLPPGEGGVLTLRLPAAFLALDQFAGTPSWLAYWDSGLAEIAIDLECLSGCGGRGVGSRPRLRLSR